MTIIVSEQEYFNVVATTLICLIKFLCSILFLVCSGEMWLQGSGKKVTAWITECTILLFL